MKFNKTFLACLVLSGSALLTACGGSSDSAPVPPPQVAATSTAAVINPTTGPTVISSVLDQTFDFTTGVSSFGTTSATSLKLSGTGVTPSFAISSAEGTASGVITYGSCIFTVTQSTFAADHPLALGNSFAVSPCSLTVGTAGVKADGGAYPTTVTLLLGTINSNPISETVSISSTGVVTVNSFTIGTITLVAATGAGS